MSYRSKTNGLKAAVVIAFILILAIAGCLIASAVMNVNVICLFKHKYGEDGVCVRCGKDKPIENESEPQAFIVEPYRFTADSARLLYSDGVSTYASGGFTDDKITSISVVESIPADYVLVREGDDLSALSTLICGIVGYVEPDDLQAYKALSTNKGSLWYWEQAYDEGIWEHTVGLTFSDKFNAQGSNTMINPAVMYVNPQFGTMVAGVRFTFTPGSLGTVLSFGDLGSHAVFYRPQTNKVPTAPTKEGYTFTGWYTDEACTNKYTASTVTSDITLYAGFTANTYGIKFNANSGSGNMANESMTYDQAKNLTTNTFTKDHYSFKGWSTSADGEVVYSNGQSVKNLAATDGAIVELFAQWERSEVKVDFVANGVTTTTWIAIGTKATLPENPVKEGYNFVGWFFEDDTEYTTQNISEDITLIAKFAIIRCTITFIVDGEVYAVYVCDWGTSLADALSANNINNPLLMSVEGEYSRNF